MFFIFNIIVIFNLVFDCCLLLCTGNENTNNWDLQRVPQGGGGQGHHLQEASPQLHHRTLFSRRVFCYGPKQLNLNFFLSIKIARTFESSLIFIPSHSIHVSYLYCLCIIRVLLLLRTKKKMWCLSLQHNLQDFKPSRLLESTTPSVTNQAILSHLLNAISRKK